MRKVIGLIGLALLGAGFNQGLVRANPPIDSPTSVIARAADGEAIVSWTAPINTGGLLVDDYTVVSTPGNHSCSTSGSPAATTCKVTGLTNGTAYTFKVVASTVNGLSDPSANSSSVTPIAGTTGVNFIGADASSVKWGSDYVYASAPRGGVAWPTYVYNNYSYSGTSLGTVFTAATVNSNSATSPNDCSSAWQWVQILCDSDAGNTGTLRRNDPSYVYKPGFNAGLTIDSVSATDAFIVIDLGSVRNFTTLRVFQMFSDGKVTEAAIYKHASTGTTWPTVSDAGWVEVKRAKISAGKQVSASSSTTCPTSLDFSATSSRYIKLNFKNQGEFGDTSWIEVGAAKLFFETEIPVPDASCPPEPPTNATATAGNATATVSWLPSAGSVNSYRIQYSSNNGSSWSNATTSPSTISGTANNATVTGLTNGSNYIFRVQAVNSAGLASPYTPPSSPSVSPQGTLPNPPGSVSVTPIAYAARISWPAVTGATSYTVMGSPSGTCTATAPATNCVINNLTAGLAYTFTVTATNGSGTSGQSVMSSSATPTSVDPAPDAPQKPTATVSGTTATVSVAAGASGGMPTSYTVTATPGGLTCTVTGASGSCNIAGLTPGTSYSFSSIATNSAGSSTSSAASDSVTVANSPTNSGTTADNSGSSTVTTGTTSGNNASYLKKKYSYAVPITSASPSPTGVSASPNATQSAQAEASSTNSSKSNSSQVSSNDYGLLAVILGVIAALLWFIAFRRKRDEQE